MARAGEGAAVRGDTRALPATLGNLFAPARSNGRADVFADASNTMPVMDDGSGIAAAGRALEKVSLVDAGALDGEENAAPTARTERRGLRAAAASVLAQPATSPSLRSAAPMAALTRCP